MEVTQKYELHVSFKIKQNKLKYEVSRKHFRKEKRFCDHSRIDKKLCSFSNELLIDITGASLRLATATELLSKTKRQLKKLIQKHCEEDILDNEKLEEPDKREKLKYR